jgi:hypothetical protein
LQFQIEKKSGEWQIIPAEGKLVGQIVATAEGVQLDNASLLPDGSIVGTVRAVWGATIRESTFDYPEVIRGLGINRAFNNEARIPVRYRGGQGYFFENRIVRAARRVIAFGDSVRALHFVELS